MLKWNREVAVAVTNQDSRFSVPSDLCQGRGVDQADCQRQDQGFYLLKFGVSLCFLDLGMCCCLLLCAVR